MTSGRISAAVFAHNEAQEIEASLSALLAAGLGSDDRVHVLVNGSTDATLAIVERLAADEPRLVPHALAFGDKCNAWNTYVYTIADPADDHVFLDGDVRAQPGAVSALQATRAAHPEALAVSSLPTGGRRSPAWSARILADHGLPGNLYLLPGSTLAAMREARYFLPVGMVGDDTFLRWSLVRGLDAAAAPDKTRIRPAAEARFGYESFPLDSRAGLTALMKRHRRYARRDLEMQLLTAHVAAHGFAALPPYISDLYGAARPWTGLSGRWRLRTVLAADAYRHARRHRGRRPGGAPWEAVFGPGEADPSARSDAQTGTRGEAHAGAGPRS